MDYNWLTSGCDHDPAAIDANLAEIDFDDFKNEDIQNAYAFSLQSYVSFALYSIFLKRQSTNVNVTNLKPGYSLIPKIVNKAVSVEYFSTLRTLNLLDTIPMLFQKRCYQAPSLNMVKEMQLTLYALID